jgi:succinate-semialdehyde dehydrogenase/glutarate-semialdehyde dehydrogenase
MGFFVYLNKYKLFQMKSIYPFNNKLILEYPEMDQDEILASIHKNFLAWQQWNTTGFSQRKERMLLAAQVLRKRKKEFSELITLEMGKRIEESRQEIEKCAWVCEHYANHAEHILSEEPLESDASRSLAAFQPIGPVLAIMPRNFPFWQVFRFAAPALMAGNSALLKHASNVQGCSLAIESIFEEAGFPENLFKSLVISSSPIESIIANDKVRAATITGSDGAGRQVASIAGKYLKKTVLELGGSDAFIVCEDADLDLAAQNAAASRMICSGQSCIAAKRFIVVRNLADEFIDKMKERFEALKPGDPMEESTNLAPLAKPDLVEAIEKQVNQSIEMGARVITGGKRLESEGNFFAPTIMTNLTSEMPFYREETFGPVAAVITVEDEVEAIEVANNTKFGLGASVWTKDADKGRKMASLIESGSVFINGIVKSDPRLPFGGIKNSGYGRELSGYGIKEFVNIKTIWIK